MSDIEQTDEYRRGYCDGLEVAVKACQDVLQLLGANVQTRNEQPVDGSLYSELIEKLKGGAE